VTSSEVSIGAWMAFAELAAPLLLAMLIIGIVVGALQSMTQIREASIAFILKLACVALVTTLSGPLMMRGLERYATTLITSIPSLIHG
jgi:flagellar biosynthesis protein FliQ